MVSTKALWILISLVSALVAVSIYLRFSGLGFGSAGEDVQKLVGGVMRTCPSDVMIEEYSERMAMYLDESLGITEPSYSIDIFEEYLSCADKGAFTQQEINEYEPEIVNCAEAAYIAYIEFLDAKVNELELLKKSPPSAALQQASDDYDDGPVSDPYEQEYAYETQLPPDEVDASDAQSDSGAPQQSPEEAYMEGIEADLKYYKNLLKEYEKKHDIFRAIYQHIEPQKICNYEATGKTTYPVCKSAASDPDKDGWGWEDGQSCKVELSSYPACVKSYDEPDFELLGDEFVDSKDGKNDGWGWENSQSCKMLRACDDEYFNPDGPLPDLKADAECMPIAYCNGQETAIVPEGIDPDTATDYEWGKIDAKGLLCMKLPVCEKNFFNPIGQSGFFSAQEGGKACRMVPYCRNKADAEADGDKTNEWGWIEDLHSTCRVLSVCEDIYSDPDGPLVELSDVTVDGTPCMVMPYCTLTEDGEWGWEEHNGIQLSCKVVPFCTTEQHAASDGLGWENDAPCRILDEEGQSVMTN